VVVWNVVLAAGCMPLGKGTPKLGNHLFDDFSLYRFLGMVAGSECKQRLPHFWLLEPIKALIEVKRVG
jgi:hypothetical protein